MHTDHLFTSWHLTSPTQHTNSCPPVCILATCLYPGICLLPFSTRNFVPLCVYRHFAGILIPAFCHSTYQLRFYGHCRPPICFHSPTIMYPARVQRYPHITPCGSLNTSVNASFLYTPNQTVYLIRNLVCIPPASTYLRFVLHIRIYKSAPFTYIPLSVPHSLHHTGRQTHRLSVTYITSRISSMLASTTLLLPCLTR